jgi:hypothetical protein
MPPDGLLGSGGMPEGGGLDFIAVRVRCSGKGSNANHCTDASGHIP